MLCRSYVAKEVSAAYCSKSAADSAGNMIITGSNVGYERSEHIERCTVAQAFLQLHIRSNLVVGHVAGAFYHNLYALIPSALCQFTQVEQLLNLRSVGSISNAAGPQTIAKADGYIIFGTDIKNFIIVFIQWVFSVIVQHPAGDKAAAAADNVHLTAFVNECFQHIFVDTAMNGHEVSAICSLLADNIENIFLSHLNHCATLLNGFYSYLIHRHSANHYGRCSNNCLTGSTDIVAGGKVHNRIRTCVNSSLQFCQLRFRIRIAAGGADVSVNLYGKTGAYTARNNIFMINVAWNSDSTVCYAFANKFCSYMLLLCDNFHCLGNHALACQLHLCCHDFSSL